MQRRNVDAAGIAVLHRSRILWSRKRLKAGLGD